MGWMAWWTSQQRYQLKAVKDRVFRRPAFHLIVDPRIRFFEPGPQGNRRLPAEKFFDQGVVTAPPANTFGRIQFVFSFERDSGNGLDHVNELVDRDHFRAAEIDGIEDLALHDGLRAMHAVVNVLKTAGLESIPPDFDFLAPPNFAAMTLRQIAAGAFSRPPSKVPCGP